LLQGPYAGFSDVRPGRFAGDGPYSLAFGRGRIRASAGIGATLDEAKVKRFDAELASMLAARHGAEPMAVPHRVWTLSAIAPGLLA
jgi:hypothetical protein